MDGLSYDDAATINKIETVLVPVQLKNGSMGEKQQAIGYYQGRRVVRDGYAYGFVRMARPLVAGTTHDRASVSIGSGLGVPILG